MSSCCTRELEYSNYLLEYSSTQVLEHSSIIIVIQYYTYNSLSEHSSIDNIVIQYYNL